MTRPETGQIPRTNKVLERQVWRVQVTYLHSAAHAGPSFQILSVCTVIDDEDEPISAWTIVKIQIDVKLNAAFLRF